MIIYLTNALKADEGDDRKVKSALQQKLNECTDKVKMLYLDDKRFTNLLTVTKLNFWQKLSSKNKKYFIIFVLCVFWFVVSLIAALVEKINEPPSYDEVKQETKDKIHDTISDDDLEEATLLLQKVDKYRQDDYVDQYQNLLKAYIDKGDLENASSLLQGVDHMNQSEFKSQYLYVINAYISKGDIKGAEKVISGYTWSSKEDYQFFYKQIYDYYIEKGDQENAKRFTPEAVGELYDNIHNR